MNRLELTPPGASAESRYKKIVANHHEIDAFFVEAFLDHFSVGQVRRPYPEDGPYLTITIATD